MSNRMTYHLLEWARLKTDESTNRFRGPHPSNRGDRFTAGQGVRFTVRKFGDRIEQRGILQFAEILNGEQAHIRVGVFEQTEKGGAIEIRWQPAKILEHKPDELFVIRWREGLHEKFEIPC